MIITLTGANGFLGKYIYSSIKSLYEVYTLGRKSSKINCDLSKNIPNLPLSNLIIHAAGKAHNKQNTSDEIQRFYDDNVIGTTNLLKGIEAVGLPAYFVFISSVSVYGLSEGNLITEDHPLLAKDTYGLTKIKAEAIIQEWCLKNDVKCTILRLPLILGIDPPGNLRAMIKGIKGGYYFNIGGGEQKKSMVLAEDVAKFICKVCEIGGVYNLTDGCHPSFVELSNYISFRLGKGKTFNLPIWLAKILARCGDFLGERSPFDSNKLKKITSDLTFDDSKAREAFGWDPSPVLEGFKISGTNL